MYKFQEDWQMISRNSTLVEEEESCPADVLCISYSEGFYTTMADIPSVNTSLTGLSTRSDSLTGGKTKIKEKRNLLHGFEESLAVILEGHDELQLSSSRLHGCENGNLRLDGKYKTTCDADLLTFRFINTDSKPWASFFTIFFHLDFPDTLMISFMLQFSCFCLTKV